MVLRVVIKMGIFLKCALISINCSTMKRKAFASSSSSLSSCYLSFKLHCKACAAAAVGTPSSKPITGELFFSCFNSFHLLVVVSCFVLGFCHNFA